jgi:hypothetical protein
MERLAITLASVEEILEFAGLILFIDGAMSHLTHGTSAVNVSITT